MFGLLIGDQPRPVEVLSTSEGVCRNWKDEGDADLAITSQHSGAHGAGGCPNSHLF
jgi:hypothetical protein